MKEPFVATKASPKTTLTLHQMFDLSREKWGLGFQIDMLVEELNELAVAALHLKRKVKNQSIHDQRVNAEKFAEEIADVEFMLAEMKYYYENAWLIAHFRKNKEDYLLKLLEADKP